MMAITLHRPWPFAILRLDKRIECRTWRPSPHLLKPGDPLAIHAGRQWDNEGVGFIAGTAMIDPRLLLGTEQCRDQGLVGLCVFKGVVTASSDPWFCGPYGWLLDDIVELPRPIATPGRHGLWMVPDRVMSVMVRETELGSSRPSRLALKTWAESHGGWPTLCGAAKEA